MADALTRVTPGSGLFVRPAYRELGYAQALDDVWLRPEVSSLLAGAVRSLRGHGLLVWDGWRPPGLQRTLYERYRAELADSTGLSGEELAHVVARYVSDPDRADVPPAHLTGAAVDLTLCDPATGEPRDMGGGFDELTERSLPGHYDAGPYASLRATLYEAMREAGFERLATEWWHFEHGTDLWARERGAEVRYGPITGPEAPARAT